jgi:hypothetical protein
MGVNRQNTFISELMSPCKSRAVHGIKVTMKMVFGIKVTDIRGL